LTPRGTAVAVATAASSQAKNATLIAEQKKAQYKQISNFFKSFKSQINGEQNFKFVWVSSCSEVGPIKKHGWDSGAR
jgi:hypothetical protein